MKLMLAGLLLIGWGCHKDPVVPPTYPTFDAPDWKENEPESYEYTMTVAVVLPDSLRNNEDASDQLAAFAKNECRGIAERIEVSTGKYVWMALLLGKANSEDEAIHFMYYSAKSRHKYRSTETLQFANDGVYGTIDAPQVIEMKIVTEL